MKILSIIILLFILSALAIGSGIYQSDISLIDNSINNVSQSINNITLTPSTESSIPNMDGIYLSIEKYIHFVGTFLLEVMRTGIHFGRDNPEYFNPSFIYKIIKLIVILVIVSLLIKPVGYVLIFLILGIIHLKNKYWKKKNGDKNSHKL